MIVAASGNEHPRESTQEEDFLASPTANWQGWGQPAGMCEERQATPAQHVQRAHGPAKAGSGRRFQPRFRSKPRSLVKQSVKHRR